MQSVQPIILTKGVPVTLTKDDGSAVSLKKVHVGAGWNASRGGSSYDLDVAVLLLESSKAKRLVAQANGKQGIVYFGEKVSSCGSIILDKDNRTGEGDGYDENINMNLETVPETINCLALCIDIFNAEAKGQTFGQVEDAYIDVNIEGLPSIKIDLTEDHSADTTVHVADIYRHNGEWRVKKIDLGRSDGIRGMLSEYGALTQ